MLELLGEVGANFSLQLSSRTQFTKINNKKVIAENQCEKHKKSSLVCSMIALQGLPFDLPPLDKFKGKNKIVSLQLLAVTLSTIYSNIYY